MLYLKTWIYNRQTMKKIRLTNAKVKKNHLVYFSKTKKSKSKLTVQNMC